MDNVQKVSRFIWRNIFLYTMCKYMDWINLAQHRYERRNFLRKLSEPSNSIKNKEPFEQMSNNSFSNRIQLIFCSNVLPSCTFPRRVSLPKLCIPFSSSKLELSRQSYKRRPFHFLEKSRRYSLCDIPISTTLLSVSGSKMVLRSSFS